MRLPHDGRTKLTTPFAKLGTTWKAGWHIGVDLVGLDSKDIHAIAAGIVESLNAHGSDYGNHICIRHADNTMSLYAHLKSIKVSRGQAVSEGQVIGVEGSTGKSSASHLHLEIHKGPYKYPPTKSKPANAPWVLNPCEVLGIENKVGEVEDMQVTKVSFILPDNKKVEVAGFMVKDTNYIGARALLEALGYKVGWDGKNILVTK